MKSTPFITILTASLNSGATIRKTIESIRDQSFQDLEHIVIDGESRDETPMVLKKSGYQRKAGQAANSVIDHR